MGSSAAVTVYDTSEYIYRNSSVKLAGFKGNIGTIVNDNTLQKNGFERTEDKTGVIGTEDITRTITLLTAAEQTDLANMINAIEACTINRFCADRANLTDKASIAWDRAVHLLDEFDDHLADQLALIKTEAMNTICLRENTWARAAGSSLNCAVSQLKIDAEIYLAEKLASVTADAHLNAQKHQTEAFANAYANELAAVMEPQKLGIASVTNFWQVIRGATNIDVTDRGYTEDKDFLRRRRYDETNKEDMRQINALAELYNEVRDTADNSGAYSSDLDDAYSAASTLASVATGG